MQGDGEGQRESLPVFGIHTPLCLSRVDVHDVVLLIWNAEARARKGCPDAEVPEQEDGILYGMTDACEGGAGEGDEKQRVEEDKGPAVRHAPESEAACDSGRFVGAGLENEAHGEREEKQAGEQARGELGACEPGADREAAECGEKASKEKNDQSAYEVEGKGQKVKISGTRAPLQREASDEKHAGKHGAFGGAIGRLPQSARGCRARTVLPGFGSIKREQQTGLLRPALPGS